MEKFPEIDKEENKLRSSESEVGAPTEALREGEGDKEARLESIREELRDFKEKEEKGEIGSKHLVTRFHPGVDIEKLTEEDLKMFEQLKTLSPKEILQYNFSVPKDDKNRKQFVAFLSNIKQEQIASEFLEKMEENK